MTRDELLKQEGWAPNKIVEIGEEIYNIAKDKPGAASAIVPIESPVAIEFFKDINATHFVLLNWLKTNGLFADYEKWANGDTALEDDISFQGRLESAKEISREENNVVAPEAPEPPVVDTTDDTTDVSEVVKETENKNVTSEVRFNSYVERTKYIKEQGFVIDTSVKGYVKDNNRFIDMNAVKVFEAPDDIIDDEFKKFVAIGLNTLWENPLDKKAEEALKTETKSDLPDITEGLNEETTNEIVGSSLTPEQRREALVTNGYVLNKNTYQWISPDSKNLISDLKIMDNELWSALGIPDTVVKENRLQEKLKDLISAGWEMDFSNNVLTLPESALKITEEELSLVLDSNWEAYLSNKTSIAANNKLRIERAKLPAEISEKEKLVVEDETIEEKEEDLASAVGTDVNEFNDTLSVHDILKVAREIDKKISNNIAQSILNNYNKIENYNDNWSLIIEQLIYEELKEEDNIVTEKLNTVNFFSKLLSYKFHSVDINITRIDDERFKLKLKPKSEMEDKALLELQAISLIGTVEDFDKEFFNEIDKPLTLTSKLFSQSDQYLKDLEKVEKEAKFVKDLAENIKKATEAAEKYAAGEKATKATTIKKWEAVIALDPKNKKAIEALAKLNEAKLL